MSATRGGEAGEGGVVTVPLPAEVLEAIVGCWQLEDRERWAIERTKAGGAQVARTLLGEAKGEYVKRAALPSDIVLIHGKRTLAFSTAGPIHALRFVFSANTQGLEGSWATSHAPGAAYQTLGGRVTLRRCADSARPMDP